MTNKKLSDIVLPMEESKSLKISIRSFITAVAIIFALMVFTYVLTFIVPGGMYGRTVTENGNTIIDTNSVFTQVEGGIPFWKWLLSPVLVLGAEGNVTLISIIAFLFVIGAVFQSLQNCSFMNYMLEILAFRFGKVRYRFMAVLMLFFMLMGALMGSFEEVVPMVPIVVALSVSLGWDEFTGIAMSLLAVGCGFASGICNPFTVGIAQRLVGLPMFSGIWLRCLSFVLIYGLLLVFVRTHAKKTEKEVVFNEQRQFKDNVLLSKAVKRFAIIFFTGIATVILSCFITALQDYTMIIVALMFLVGGVAACITVKMPAKEFFNSCIKGCSGIAPSVLMILMAASIKYTMVEANIQDTVLYMAINAAGNLPKPLLVLSLYFMVLVMNFFIGSGSAKAFMMIPLLVPLARVFGVSAQLCIVAFAFGDGFSNVFYPTNAALLISLGLVDVNYGKWVKYSWKFQLLNLILISGLLLLGMAIGY